MKNTFIILWKPGPDWVPGKTVREQPYWNEHAAFMDPLFDNGMVILGGPFADATGSLVVVEAESEQRTGSHRHIYARSVPGAWHFRAQQPQTMDAVSGCASQSIIIEGIMLIECYPRFGSSCNDQRLPSGSLK